MDSHQQKISHLKALYHLACADNVLTRSEMIYIRNVAERLGVSEDELETFENEEPDLILPDREYKVYALFHRLAIIVMIDNEMHDEERKYCFNLGVRMGLHPNAVGEIIDFVASYGPTRAVPSEVMDIFRKYMS